MKPGNFTDNARPTASAEELLTPKEAAKFLKMSTSFLAKKRMHGDGPIYNKSGRSVRYSKAALLNWLKSRECRSTKDELEDLETTASIAPELVD
jgi:predicted DNA-binding transcriptional regulator AlpA